MPMGESFKRVAMSDNKWTALATIASTATDVACAFIDRRKHKDRTPELHERVALLEKAVEELQKKAEAKQ